MLEAVGDNAQGKRLDFCFGLELGQAVREDTRKVGDLRDPPTIGFQLELNGECHRRILMSQLQKREPFNRAPLVRCAKSTAKYAPETSSV